MIIADVAAMLPERATSIDVAALMLLHLSLIHHFTRCHDYQIAAIAAADAACRYFRRRHHARAS